MGYFTVGGTYMPLTPARMLDTREGFGALGAGEGVDLAVTGYDGVAVVGASAVVLSLTVVGPTATGISPPTRSTARCRVSRT